MWGRYLRPPIVALLVLSCVAGHGCALHLATPRYVARYRPEAFLSSVSDGQLIAESEQLLRSTEIFQRSHSRWPNSLRELEHFAKQSQRPLKFLAIQAVEFLPSTGNQLLLQIRYASLPSTAPTRFKPVQNLVGLVLEPLRTVPAEAWNHRSLQISGDEPTP